MPKYKLTIEYDGSGYFGWQWQAEFKSVQGTVEKAIKAFCGEEVELYAAGRTDTGVHALGQVAHFEMSREFPERQVCEAINFHLQKERVVVLRAELVDQGFHARFSAQQRAYCYKILQRQSRPVIDQNRVWHIRQKLDVEAMKGALSLLVGHHDFSSFRASGCQASSPQITLDEINIEVEGEYLLIYIRARSFLYHMVRNIVGSVVEVGKSKITVDEFKHILEAKDRRLAGMTAPPCGLYFLEVQY